MQKIDSLGKVLYKIISFIGLVVGFMILYFMIEMFIMIFATEVNVVNVFSAYMEWIYINISIISIFLIRNKILGLVSITLIVFFYHILKRKWSKENMLLIIAELFFLYVPTNLEAYLIKNNIKLLDFVFTDLGVCINLFTFFIFSVSLLITLKEMKRLCKLKKLA